MIIKRRWPWIVGALLAGGVIAVGVCESLGWPFLAAPLQRSLSTTLDREVRFSQDSGSAAQVHIGLIGSVRARADTIVIGAPAWSKTPHMLRARHAQVRLGYADLWRAWRGEPLHIRELRADELDGSLERLADGRSSWQFGAQRDTAAVPRSLPTVGVLQVGAGTLSYDDAVMEVDLDARFSLTDGVTMIAPAASAASAASAPAGLQLTATGQFRKQPIRVEARTAGVLPLLGEGADKFAMPVTLDATVGRARVVFNGTATDVLTLGQLRGRFSVNGPSLAAVGDPIGVTLPTTPPFRTSGLILKEGQVWNAVFEQATIGSSKLAGAFTFDAGRKLPLLSGRLTGTRLQLADLGPAVGTPTPALPERTAKAGKVLPNRPFDLPALRAMDANVLIDIDDLDLGSSILEPLRPMRAHLVLQAGVLTLRDIDARTGQGTLAGRVQLDGRDALALWTTELRWDGVRLESWIKQTRKDSNAPPYVTGRLNGQATLAGQGKSTADILGSLKGGVRMYLLDGSISHLAIEAAGLDIAQALGVLIKGDDALPIQCTVADLVADRGLLRPRVLVLDTTDSTLWVDGSLSLATEALDLRVVVTPKDFSPLALRTPVRLRGSFADPAVSIEAGRLGARVGAAALLALVNPVAAILPFMDIGSSDAARDGAAKCQALAQRKAGKAPVSPERAGKVAERIEARRPR